MEDELCGLERAEPDKESKPFGGVQKIVSESQLIELFILLDFGFAFFRLCGCPGFSLLKNVFNLILTFKGGHR